MAFGRNMLEIFKGMSQKNSPRYGKGQDISGYPFRGQLGITEGIFSGLPGYAEIFLFD